MTTDISEEHIASLLGIEEKAEKETSLKAGDKQIENMSLMGFYNSVVIWPSNRDLFIILKETSDDDETNNLVALREETF